MQTHAKKARRAKKLPAYRERKPYGQAIVTLTDSMSGKRKDYWLGEHGSLASREMYHRVLSQWESMDRRLPPAEDPPKADIEKLTIAEVILDYKAHVDSTFKLQTRHTIYMVMKLLRQYFGSTPAEEFGPSKLRLLRDQMIKGDPRKDPPRKPWSRTTVNKSIHQLCAMFRWAASHEMLPASVHAQLKTVGALRKGTSAASESDPVEPVAIKTVTATKPFLSRQVKALVELQLLTGARGGEILTLRPVDIEMDKSKRVWLVRLDEHKNAHRGHKRIIVFGPKAQLVIKPFLVGRPLDAYLFSPAEAERERREAAAAKRKTRPGQGNSIGTNRSENPKRQPGNHYTSAGYRRAIERACDKAGVDRWHPHQLRHTAATEIRRKFGLEAARLTLGHSSALVTDAVYAERDLTKVAEVMAIIG